MAIPKMTDDLEIIQKLSDLPNATDGLTAEELKAKFDEGAELIKEYINGKLIPALVAKNIGFSAIEGVGAGDVQSAIAEVQKQVKDAASGSLPNGSVTKEKIAADLLARMYGGVPWVSMNTPGADENTEDGFPIGQIWLRPEFTVTNARKTTWSYNGCTVNATAQKVTMTGNKSATDATMTQSITNIGKSGDTVQILFDVTAKDSEIMSLTASINGGEAKAISGNVNLTGKVDGGGAVSLRIAAAWPSMTLADGSVVLENLTIVNVSAIERQVIEAEVMKDWNAYLRAMMPFVTYVSPCQTYMQETEGNWHIVSYEVTPMERGGTGRNERFDAGLLLYGGPDGEFAQVPAPEEANSLLSFENGNPKWVTREQIVTAEGALRSKSGTYTGNGQDRTIDFGCTPQILFIRQIDSGYGGNVSSKKVETRLMNGEEVYTAYVVTAEVASGTKDYRTYNTAKLDGNVLRNTSTYQNENYKSTERYFNKNGVQYQWLALY